MDKFIVPMIAAFTWILTAWGLYLPGRPLVSIIMANLAGAIVFIGASCINLSKIGR